MSTRVHVGSRVGRHVAGGRQMEGPRVSRPWLGISGGNVNALPRPTFYPCNLSISLLCGTMFPHVFLLQVTWTRGRRWIQARSVDRVDPSPRDHPSTHVPKRMSKWLQSKGSPISMWRHEEH